MAKKRRYSSSSNDQILSRLPGLALNNGLRKFGGYVLPRLLIEASANREPPIPLPLFRYFME